MNVLKFIGI